MTIIKTLAVASFQAHKFNYKLKLTHLTGKADVFSDSDSSSKRSLLAKHLLAKLRNLNLKQHLSLLLVRDLRQIH